MNDIRFYAFTDDAMVHCVCSSHFISSMHVYVRVRFALQVHSVNIYQYNFALLSRDRERESERDIVSITLVMRIWSMLCAALILHRCICFYLFARTLNIRPQGTEQHTNYNERKKKNVKKHKRLPEYEGERTPSHWW